MVTIFLMRHAKAERPAAGLDDFDRALQPSGRVDAQAMGRLLIARFGPPGRVVCSDAKRTRETLDCLGLDLAVDQVTYSAELFEGTRQATLDALRETRSEPGIETVLLVGHNPGCHDAALALTKEGESTGWSHLAAAFPTASLAVLECPTPLSELAEGSCFLRDFITPEDLPA